MPRWVRLCALAVLVSPLFVIAGSASAQLRYVWVNNTQDLILTGQLCLPQADCSLRAAIERAEGHQFVVTACFDPAEVPGARPCPPGARPLLMSDENYDPETGKWTLLFRDGAVPFILSQGGTRLDFTYGIETWRSPADNRIVINPDIGRRPSSDAPTHVLLLEGNDNQVAGLEIRGRYQITAILVRRGSSNNVFGPGLVLAGIPEGVGLSIEGGTTVANRVTAVWCGITGDGTVVDPVRDDCIRVYNGSSANVIGGATEADRNILAASAFGVGVSVEGNHTRDNVIEGNWIGLSVDGAAALANSAGVRIVGGAFGTRVRNNVLSGNANAGITVFDHSAGSVIENNIIGRDPTAARCIANGGVGISLQGTVADTLIRRNTIHCNRDGGIALRDPGIQRVKITENSLSQNHRAPLVIDPGANGGVEAPIVLAPAPDIVRGRACAGCTVEVFSDPLGEAGVFEGAVVAGEDGGWLLQKESFAYPGIRTTATDGDNTSALSPVVVLPRDRPTATPIAYESPTPEPTREPVLVLIYLPWELNRWHH